MNCECLDIDSQSVPLLATMDLTKIDRLFLSVLIINGSHYAIHNRLIVMLNNLDLSKIIILAYPKTIAIYTKKYLDDIYIPINLWYVPIMPLHSNFTYNNLNFIYTDNFKTVTEFYLKDSITVVLCWYDISKLLYIQSLQRLPAFVDILISARQMRFDRTLESQFGIKKIVWDYTENKSGQYFRLNDKMVTLHKMRSC